tara:strand:- start:10778 stop:12235 length:1458 start_codon:yes stop_codon:yes gene_type:complete
MEINILGSGIGGMAAAALLAKNGAKVNVIEQNNYPGGKASQIKFNGYVFDSGPSLLTLPEWIDELFIECSKNPRDYFNYKRLDKITRYFFKDNTYVDVENNIRKTAQNLNLATGLKEGDFLRYFNKLEKAYTISENTFLNGMEYDFNFIKNAILWFYSLGIKNIFSPMVDYNSKRLNTEKIELIMNRFATYTGSSPYKTPAFMNQLAVVEMIKGAYFPEDGIYSIPLALFKLCKDLGVNFIFNQKVLKIDYNLNDINVVTDKNKYRSKFLISNIDYNITQILLGRKNNISSKDLSTSAIVFYWGINSQFKDLDLHNIIFSSNYKKEFTEIFENMIIPIEPTIYINISSKVEKSHAPIGCENWFVMINVPSISNLISPNEIERVRSFIIERINKKFNVDLESMIEGEKVLTPKTLFQNTGSYMGSLYGKNQNTFKSIIKRQSNIDPKNKAIFYVGGSVHPGGGIPLALKSGLNTAKKIFKNYKKVS